VLEEKMSEITIGIIGLMLLIVIFLTGLELGFGMAVLGFIGFSYLVSVKAGFSVLSQDVFDTLSAYGFTVLPVFVLMGEIAFVGGIAKKLYDSAYKFIGHIPGGLAMATVAAASVFSCISGSTSATAATFSYVAIPEMDRYHYGKRLSSGIVAASGTLGPLIPPSVPLIVYGIITEQSIGELFLASVIPGVLVAVFFMLAIYGWCKINPSMGPKGEKSSWRERVVSTKDVGWITVIFLLVMGGMMKGFFTPTEAGSVGCFAIGLLAFAKRDLNFKGFGKSLTDSVYTSCMVIILIIGSTIFGHFIAVTKIPLIAADWIIQLPFNRYIILALISMIYLVGGSFIDDMAFMILATPIFYPVILKLGFDLIWFGIFLQIVVMIGVIIPPMAINIFVVNNITKVSAWDIYCGVTPFLIGLILTAVLMVLFPQIALYIPSLIKT
jgi:tripartite ATP-independent transporter DctM subunit